MKNERLHSFGFRSPPLSRRLARTRFRGLWDALCSTSGTLNRHSNDQFSLSDLILTWCRFSVLCSGNTFLSPGSDVASQSRQSNSDQGSERHPLCCATEIEGGLLKPSVVPEERKG